MIRIVGEEPKGEIRGSLFRFVCQSCESEIEADSSELEPSWWDWETKKFMCPRCKCPRYVEKPNMTKV